MEPRTLDNYRILNILGTGGMATVYRARDLRLQRDVAVKVLHDHIAAREDNRLRFEREAQAVARLAHPNILQIYGFSSPDAPVQYLATELIQGPTLREFIDQNPLLIPEAALLLALPVARALQHAHDNGVIHRDFKPENVMITREGAPRLMDFGLARILDGKKLTSTGAILGSPAHMSPELIEGQPTDARADIFAFGTTLYFLCTGLLPFDGHNPAVILNAILSGTHVPAWQHNPRVSDGIGAILERCLRRQPDQRYPSMTAVISDLECQLTEAGIDPDRWPLRELMDGPAAFQNRLADAVVQHTLAAATDARAQGQMVRTIRLCDRILAFNPEHAGALQLLQGARGLVRRREALLSLGLIALVIALLGLAVAAQRHRSAGQMDQLSGQAALHAQELARDVVGQATRLARQRDQQARQVRIDAGRAGVLGAIEPADRAQRLRLALPRTAERVHLALLAARAASDAGSLRAAQQQMVPNATVTLPPERLQRRDPVPSTRPEAPDAPGEDAPGAVLTHVHFRIFPPAALIQLGERNLGQAAQLNAEGLWLPPGRHQLLATLDGFSDARATTSFTVQEGQRMTVTVRVPWPPARLTVRSQAPGRVFVDNLPVGFTNETLTVPVEGSDTRRSIVVRAVRRDREGIVYEERHTARAGETLTLVAGF